MKYKELTNDIIKECVQELKDCKKKKYIDMIIDLQGGIGLIYQTLQEMYYHGRFVYPKTYEYRRELTKYYLDYVNQQAKCWRKKHL